MSSLRRRKAAFGDPPSRGCPPPETRLAGWREEKRGRRFRVGGPCPGREGRTTGGPAVRFSFFPPWRSASQPSSRGPGVFLRERETRTAQQAPTRAFFKSRRNPRQRALRLSQGSAASNAPRRRVAAAPFRSQTLCPPRRTPALLGGHFLPLPSGPRDPDLLSVSADLPLLGFPRKEKSPTRDVCVRSLVPSLAFSRFVYVAAPHRRCASGPVCPSSADGRVGGSEHLQTSACRRR